MLDNLAAAWVPTYQSGDFTIHSCHTPHFTTGYGTASHRYSVEIRAIERPLRLVEPQGALPFWELLRRKAALLPS